MVIMEVVIMNRIFVLKCLLVFIEFFLFFCYVDVGVCGVLFFVVIICWFGGFF